MCTGLLTRAIKIIVLLAGMLMPLSAWGYDLAFSTTMHEGKHSNANLAVEWNQPPQPVYLGYASHEKYDERTSSYALLGVSTFFNYAQTYSNLYKQNGYELNPLLGRHPSKAKLSGSVMLASAVLVLISYCLDPPYDKIFLNSVNKSMLVNIEYDQFVSSHFKRPSQMPIMLVIRL